MAIATKGFDLPPLAGAKFADIKPTTFDFVDGSTLAEGADMGIYNRGYGAVADYLQNKNNNLNALLAGIVLSVDKVADAGVAVANRKYSEDQDEVKHQRNLEVAQVRATGQLNKPLTPLQQVQLEKGQEELTKLKRENSYSDSVPGEDIDLYAPLDDVPAPTPAGQEPVEPPLPEMAPPKPLAGTAPAPAPAPEKEGEGSPSKPLASAQTQEETGQGDSSGQPEEIPTGSNAKSSQRIVPVKFKDGSTALWDRATQKIVAGTYAPPSANVPQETPDGMQVKGAKRDSKGRLSYDYETDTSEKDKEKDKSQIVSGLNKAKRSIEDIDKILSIAENSTLPALGKFSDYLAKMPVTTGASDIRNLINNVTADVAFETLAEMRRNSKTGGALGSISEKELALLAAAEGSIDPSLSSDIFVSNLTRIRDARKELLKQWSKKLENLNSGDSGDTPSSEDSKTIALESQFRDLKSKISSLPRGSEARNKALEDLKDIARQYRQLTGKSINGQ